MTFLLIGLAIFGLRIGQDTLFPAKIDVINRRKNAIISS